MPAFGALLKYIFLFTVLMIPGYVMGKNKHLKEESMTSLANILTDIALPFLGFAKLMDVDVTKLRLSYIVCCIFVPIIVEVAMLGIGILVFRKKEGDKRYPINRFCTFMPNVGFIAIPLVCAIFYDVPEIVLYVAIANVLSSYMLLTLGIFILSEDKSHISVKKIFTSPVLFAIILGFACSLLPENGIKSFARDYSTHLANLATPLSMLVLGYNMSKLSLLRIIKNAGVYAVSFLRLIVSPVLAIVVLVFIQYVLQLHIDHALAMAMFIAMGVSNAGTAPALAKRHNLDGEHAAAVTIGTTILSIATIPVVYLLAEVIF